MPRPDLRENPVDTSRSHCAKYLILVGEDTAQRALLFSGEHRYLSEMFDEDGMMVDHLIRNSSPLQTPPRGLALDMIVPKQERSSEMRCFALGAA